MKTYPVFLRALAILACAFGLAACGGSGGTVNLNGTLTGVTTTGLILTDGYTALSIPLGATSFHFPTKVTSNYSYSVSVLAQPTDNTCVVTNGTGVAGTSDIGDISIACTQTSFRLGGTITGLKGDLTIVNGTLSLKIPAQADPTKVGTFEFASKVAATTHYGVTVLTQPSGQICTIAGGLGTMPSADVLTMAITCTDAGAVTPTL